MGLFTKKLCSICGKKAGMLKETLADGSYICFDCYTDIIISGKYGDVTYYPAFTYQALTLDTFKHFVQLRKDNQKLLTKFTCTESIGENIHYDANNGLIVFANKSYLNRKKQISGIAPPVYALSNINVLGPTIGNSEASTSLTGKDVVESDVLLIVGAQDTLHNLLSVKIGKVVSKSGLFKTKTSFSPEVDHVHTRLLDLIVTVGKENIARGGYCAHSDKQLTTELLYKAKDEELFTGEEIVDMLRSLNK